MSKQGAIKRYMLIVEKVSRSNFVSFENIKNFLFEHGFEISGRTLQRDLQQIRDEFGLEIEYNRLKNCYFINQSKSINMDSFLRFLEIVKTAQLLTESVRQGQNALDYISFESQGLQKGIDYLKPLLFAIQNKRLVSFIHENFESGQQKPYTIQPCLLKEYQNRWYVFGFIDGLNEFRTFGIDRIENISVKSKTFKPDSKVNPQKYFENVVGLNYSLNKPVEILLSFTPLQGKYIKTLPLHHSQKIIKETTKEIQATLFLTPNYEFLQKLLMLGDNVKILKPKELVSEIKTILKSALKQYS